MLYVEYRNDLIRTGKPIMVSVNQLQKLRGFRSVYSFDSDGVQAIREAGNTRVAKDQTLYTNRLFMDFDDCADAAAEFEQLMLDGDYRYTKWDSGNRSIHFHVCIVPLMGKGIHLFQKYWVAQNAPRADISFYNPAGIYRLPLTPHAKNPGRIKELLHYHPGKNNLHISTEAVQSQYDKAQSEDVSHFYTANNVRRLCEQTAEEGNRHPHMYRIVSTSKNTGFSEFDTLENVLFWNRNYASPPHSEKEIQTWFTRTWASL
jgi:hypothetical protein